MSRSIPVNPASFDVTKFVAVPEIPSAKVGGLGAAELRENLDARIANPSNKSGRRRKIQAAIGDGCPKGLARLTQNGVSMAAKRTVRGLDSEGKKVTLMLPKEEGGTEAIELKRKTANNVVADAYTDVLCAVLEKRGDVGMDGSSEGAYAKGRSHGEQLLTIPEVRGAATLLYAQEGNTQWLRAPTLDAVDRLASNIPEDLIPETAQEELSGGVERLKTATDADIVAEGRRRATTSLGSTDKPLEVIKVRAKSLNDADLKGRRLSVLKAGDMGKDAVKKRSFGERLGAAFATSVYKHNAAARRQVHSAMDSAHKILDGLSEEYLEGVRDALSDGLSS